jgi:hypothetical protein
MPDNSTEFERGTLSKVTRASYCSERLRTKRGHPSVPGISSLSADSIWQPLHTPKVKVAVRSKKAANSSRANSLNRIDLAQPSPAPSTSP